MSAFPKYERYKDSGVEWLGDVPEHWEVERARYIFSKTERPPRKDDGVVTAYRDGQVTLRSLRRAEGYTMAILEQGYQSVNTGELVIHGMDAFAGAIGVAEADGKCTPEYSVLTPNRGGINPYWYAHLLRLMAERGYIHIICPSVRERAPRFRFPKLQDNLLPIPPKAEQDRIVALIDRKTAEIDALIAKKQRQIELLDEQKAILINRAVTRGLNPDAKLKPSGIEWIGNIPEGWEVRKASHTLFFQEGPGLRTWQFKSAGVRVICVTNITDKGVTFSNYQKFISEKEFASSYSHFTVSKGDLLLSSSGNSWGKVASYDSDEVAILNTSTIRVNEGAARIVILSLLRWILRSEASREQLRLMMTGSCQPNFGPSHLSKLHMAVPPHEEQAQIAEYLDKVDAQIEKSKAMISRESEKLNELRSTVIAHAVTGRIKV